jgi:hypothetical protein
VSLRINVLAGIVTFTVCVTQVTLGQSKSQYHLFNPTPGNQMRSLSTDRPDFTESPNTVDAGHVQGEIDILAYSMEEAEGVDVTGLSLLNINAKIGVTNCADIQVVVPVYNSVEIDGGEKFSGFGDLLVRLKFNLFGNDGGNASVGIMPILQLPTASDEIAESDQIQGGISLPFSIGVSDGLAFGAMAQADFVEVGGKQYRKDLALSATLAKELTGKMGAYLEFISISSLSEEVTHEAYIATGGAFSANHNLQLDAGVNIGTTTAAVDLVVFAGISFRR